MKKTSTKRMLLAALLAAPILLFSAHRLSGQRVCCQGDWWLEWDRDARESFVYGYTLGFSKGHRDGCEQGTRNDRAAGQGVEHRGDTQVSVLAPPPTRQETVRLNF